MKMRTMNDYMALPYTIELIGEDATTWFARVVELPGCMTEGDSAADAVAMLQDAMAGWIELALEDGRVIPEPKPQENREKSILLNCLANDNLKSQVHS